MHTAFIVQEHESALWLYPYDGSVGFTPLAMNAGRFFDEEEAVLTAVDHCEGGFTVMQIIVKDSNDRS
jgi:hypothetical protein